MLKIPNDILPHFIAAGWSPERFIKLADRAAAHIPTGHPARNILEQLAGLTVGHSGAGRECATSHVVFEFVEDFDDDVSVWNGLLDTRLIGVATIDGGYGVLFVDTLGRHFVFNCVDDVGCHQGDDFADALRSLLLGLRGRPILRPDQSTVTVYGQEYVAGSPDVYNYD